MELSTQDGARRPGRYRVSLTGWKPFMRRTGSLAGIYHSPNYRQDVRIFPVQEKLDIMTFWLDEGIGGGGTGPCLSLYCRGFEILRFDCFGAGLGHFHTTAFMPWASRAKRLWFAEPTVEAQIERTLFELTRNLEYYLRLNPRYKVRRTQVDPAAMETACQAAGATMKSYLEQVETLCPLRKG